MEISQEEYKAVCAAPKNINSEENQAAIREANIWAKDNGFGPLIYGTAGEEGDTWYWARFDEHYHRSAYGISYMLPALKKCALRRKAAG